MSISIFTYCVIISLIALHPSLLCTTKLEQYYIIDTYTKHALRTDTLLQYAITYRAIPTVNNFYTGLSGIYYVSRTHSN